MVDIVVVLWVGVAAVIGFLLGSAYSPLYHLERKNVAIWRGQAGFWQKQYNQLLEAKEESDPINQILNFLPPAIKPIAKPIIEKYLSDPQALQSLLQKFLGESKENFQQEWK